VARFESRGAPDASGAGVLRNASMKRWVACLHAVALSGCLGGGYKLYSGPKLPENQVSVVYSQPGSGTMLLEVDGKPVARSSSTTVVSVLPGDHRLLVGFSKTYASGDTRSAAPQSANILTSAGSYYEIAAVINASTSALEVEVNDATTAMKAGKLDGIRSAAGY
jgi:hypothetical protein